MGPGSTVHGFWGVLGGSALPCMQWRCWMLLPCPVPLHPTDAACAQSHSPCGCLSQPPQRCGAALTSPGLTLTDQKCSTVVARLQQQLLRFLPADTLIQPPAQQWAASGLPYLLSRGWGQRQPRGPAEAPMGCAAPGLRWGEVGLGHHCHVPELSSSASNGPGGTGAAAAVCPWDNPLVWGVPAEPHHPQLCPPRHPGLTPTCAALWLRSCWG